VGGLRVADHPLAKLNAIAPDEFEAIDLRTEIVFHRDKRKNINALTVFSQRARGIGFRKVKEDEEVRELHGRSLPTTKLSEMVP
jgi:hypothetical protein